MIEKITFDTPIALIVFNRPETTKKVLDAIREIKPQQLFIIADAPRENNQDDLIKSNLVKAVIDEGIDWDCKVYKKYNEKNLGCGKSPSSGISWVFEQVDRCIILEDDCLPEQSFFNFCAILLEKYVHDERIMMVSGNHHLLKKLTFEENYFFSRHTQTWGWATWKRAWQFYDYDMKLWPTVKKSGWLERIIGKGSSIFWVKLFDKCYNDKIKDYWDFQWTFACWSQNGLNIIPDRNLVTNIGFGDGKGTHFSDVNTPFANLPVQKMSFPMKHPKAFLQNLKADLQIEKDVYGKISLYKRFKIKVFKLIKQGK
jgi:hypothetical protein